MSFSRRRFLQTVSAAVPLAALGAEDPGWPSFRGPAALGEPCFATPALWRGVLYFRTTESLIAIG